MWSSRRLFAPLLCFWLLNTAGCAKKEPKPMRTEPWLARPPASTSASSAAVLPLTRYALGEGSVIRFEIPTKHGDLNGTLSRVSGELAIDLSDLTRSRGQVRVDLGSLEIHADRAVRGSDPTLLERARAALELPSDPSAPPVFASFDLSSIEDPVPPLIEPPQVRAPNTAAPHSRHAHFTAVGNLLLHGFRVIRRAPASAEFTFEAEQQMPQRVLIRSRSPFVISLETHAIVALAPETESRGKAASALPTRARDARVSVELYGIKVE